MLNVENVQNYRAPAEYLLPKILKNENHLRYQGFLF